MLKEARLVQIKHYLDAIQVMLRSSEVNRLIRDTYPIYPSFLKTIIERHTNLFSMVLRPINPDSFLRSVSPVFTVRRNDTSVFYQNLHQAYADIKLPNMQEILIKAVLKELVSENNPYIREDIAYIQDTLTKQWTRLFPHLKSDFYKGLDGKEITKAYLDTLMSFDETSSLEDYVDSVFNLCGGDRLWIGAAKSSLFSQVKDENSTEQYAILTQFFLAEINIYCAANLISEVDFGKVLDESQVLSKELTILVVSALEQGLRVEDKILDFIHIHQVTFGLTEALEPKERESIINLFQADFHTIEDSPHFDEFTLLDTGVKGQFVTHQGSICTDLSLMLEAGFPELEPDYFEEVRRDYQSFSGQIPHVNAEIKPIIGDIEQLTGHINALLKDNKLAFACQLITQNIQAIIDYGAVDTLISGFMELNEQDETLLTQAIKDNGMSALNNICSMISALPEQYRFDILAKANASGKTPVCIPIAIESTGNYL